LEQDGALAGTAAGVAAVKDMGQAVKDRDQADAEAAVEDSPVVVVGEDTG